MRARTHTRRSVPLSSIIAPEKRPEPVSTAVCFFIFGLNYEMCNSANNHGEISWKPTGMATKIFLVVWKPRRTCTGSEEENYMWPCSTKLETLLLLESLCVCVCEGVSYS